MSSKLKQWLCPKNEQHDVQVLKRHQTRVKCMLYFVLGPTACCALPHSYAVHCSMACYALQYFMLCRALEHAVLCTMSRCALSYVMLCSALRNAVLCPTACCALPCGMLKLGWKAYLFNCRHRRVLPSLRHTFCCQAGGYTLGGHAGSQWG